MPRSDTRELMLEFIQSYIADHGYGPSVRELGEALGLRSTATVHYHLRALQEAGAIVMEEGKNRSISLLEGALPATGRERRLAGNARPHLPPAPAPRSSLLPIVGAVAAGQPILALEDIDGYLPWNGGRGWFALRGKGESMKNAGILPGDLVVVRPQPTAEPGEIVVARIEDEATVKRLAIENGHVLLLPENEAFSPIDGDEAAIIGLVKGVVRVYE